MFLTSCEMEDPRFSSETQYLGGVYGTGAVSSGAPQDTVSYWDGDGVSGSPSIKIRLSEQRAYFYKGKQLVGISQLSTGREGTNTPTGSFKVIQKDQDHVSNLYGDYVDAAGNVIVPNVDVNKDRKPAGTRFKGAPMPYFMRIVGGVGLIRLFTRLSGFARLYSYAGIHGRELFRRGVARHSGNCHPLGASASPAMAAGALSLHFGARVDMLDSLIEP